MASPSGSMNLGIGVSLVDNFTGPMSRLYRGLVNMGSKGNTIMSGVTSSMMSVADGVNRASVATAGFFKNAFMSYADFDGKLKNTQVIANMTGVELEKLKKKAKDIGLTTIFSPQDAARMMETMAKAGLKASDMLDMTAPISHLAAAMGTDLQQTVSMTNDIMASFGLRSKDVEHVVDMLAATVNGANITFNNLFNTLRYSGYSAKLAGMSLEEVLATAGALGNVGLKGSISGTSLMNFTMQLTKAVSDFRTNTQSKGLEQLGLTPKDILNQSGQLKTLPEIFKVLGSKYTEGDIGAVNAVNAIFGKRGGRLALIFKTDAEAIGDTIDELYNKLKSGDIKGYAQKVADVRQWGSAAGNIQALKSAFEDLQLSLAEGIAPIVTSVLKGLRALVSGLSVFLQNPFGKVVSVGTMFITILSWIVSKLARVYLTISLLQAQMAAQGFMGTTVPLGWKMWSSGFDKAGNPIMRFRDETGRFRNMRDFAQAGGYVSEGYAHTMSRTPGMVIMGSGEPSKVTGFFQKGILGKGVGFLGKILGGVLKALPVIGTIFTVVSLIGTLISTIVQWFKGKKESKDEEKQEKKNTGYRDVLNQLQGVQPSNDIAMTTRRAADEVRAQNIQNEKLITSIQNTKSSPVISSNNQPTHITINVDGTKTLDEEIYGALDTKLNV